MSAIYEEPDSAPEPVKVLITLHEGMDVMDAMGPLEVFSWAQHDKKNSGMLLLVCHGRNTVEFYIELDLSLCPLDDIPATPHVYCYVVLADSLL